METSNWPDCINNLKPPKNSLEGTVPKWIEKIYNENNVFDQSKMLVPFHPVKMLGTCTTDKYLECPNLPQHHIDNSNNLSDFRYLKDIGRYYWFDFDIIDLQGDITELRMAYNEGDADCNDGRWGQVWERNTKGYVADILSTGDCETTVSASGKYSGRFFKKKYEPFYILEAASPYRSKKYIQNQPVEVLIHMAMKVVSETQ